MFYVTYKPILGMGSADEIRRYIVKSLSLGEPIPRMIPKEQFAVMKQDGDNPQFPDELLKHPLSKSNKEHTHNITSNIHSFVMRKSYIVLDKIYFLGNGKALFI